jgi:hypothetical protein
MNVPDPTTTVPQASRMTPCPCGRDIDAEATHPPPADDDAPGEALRQIENVPNGGGLDPALVEVGGNVK